MPAFPTGVKIDWRDFGESPESVVDRAEMERGVPKQRRNASDALVELTVTAHFDTAAEEAAFTAWFFDDIAAGAAWFDWVHPRTGAVLQARFKGGELGPLRVLQKTMQACTRTFKLEYVRPAW